MTEPALKNPSDANPLWTPSPERVKASQLYAFKEKLAAESGQSFPDYHSLWQWTTEHQDTFWDRLWDEAGIIGDKGATVFQDGATMRDASFFPDSRLNYAENLLRRRDDGVAIISRNEKGEERQITFKELYDLVSRWQQAFIKAGVGQGDRVAAYMPNTPETIIVCLAATSLGAIFSSASPDFGVQGILDRFAQIEPTVLVATDGYFYNGKTLDCLKNVKEIMPQLPGLKQTVIIPFAGTGTLDGAVMEDDFIRAFEPQEMDFTRVEFKHPLFIMFSSGTTGKPKCIVHGHGGTLLQHLKELRLHCDIKRDDAVFYFTTCGWMMWNWLISALACDATLLLFDGSPFYPDGNVLWDYTSSHDCMLFGTSAKYIDALEVFHIEPGRDFDLSALKIITSTGSPLVDKGFDFVYQKIKNDVHLASIYGGTDIISASFGLGNPISPVWRAELQGPGLATAVDIYDDAGKPIPPGAGAGELVCTKPFPSMPVKFWGDDTGEKYKGAYFEVYDNIWRHGDWVERTVHNGLIVHGRSDATLNPGGVRIGTAEIYAQVEKVEGVVESIAIGQSWDNDVRIVLFVRLKEGVTLTDDLIKAIKTQVRSGASPRHVPAKIVAVADIPRTKSGKITELAVRDVVHGRPVKNVEALANPEALDLYKDLKELQN